PPAAGGVARARALRPRALPRRPARARGLYFPFGGGVRRCLGVAFATFEMKIVLARLLDRVELEPGPSYRPRVVRCSIASAPSDGCAGRHARAAGSVMDTPPSF